MKGPHFFPEALAEYEMQAPGLGDRFICMLDEALALTMEFPFAGKPVEDTPAKYDLGERVLPIFDVKIIWHPLAEFTNLTT